MWGFTSETTGTTADPAGRAAGVVASKVTAGDRDELAALALLPIGRAGCGDPLFAREVLIEKGPEIIERNPGAGHSPLM